MMSRYQEWLDGLGEKRAETLAWLESLSPAAQSMTRLWPPGTPLDMDGRRAWVVCHFEDARHVVLSCVDPAENYRKAWESGFVVPALHLPCYGDQLSLPVAVLAVISRAEGQTFAERAGELGLPASRESGAGNPAETWRGRPPLL